MDFFGSQDRARRKTGLLIGYFVVTLILMVVSLYAVADALFFYASTKSESETAVEFSWWNPGLLLAVTIGVLGVVTLGSLFKLNELRGGGETVALSLGGRRIPPSTGDRDERKLMNVVEEMALASGTPVPPVYIMDDEPGINAFAAGYSPDDAVIGVNRGTVKALSRDQLQGVIAHEFSHVLNGDMRLNIRLIGILYGIQALALIGYFVLRAGGFHAATSSRRGKSSGQLLAFGLALIVIGFVGLFFSRLIKSAISRQREYLADASAVQFTRNPDGIGGALKAIGAHVEGSQVHSPAAESASHMFFGTVLKSDLGGMLATHPPLVRRIKAVDPSFDGDFDRVRRELREQFRRRLEAEQKSEAKREQEEKTKSKRHGFQGKFAKGGFGEFPIDPAIVLAGIGLPSSQHMAFSAALLEELPDQLRHAARDTFSARCVIFAMLLDADEEAVRKDQLNTIVDREQQRSLDETTRLLPHLTALPVPFRLPVLEMIQSTLTGLSEEQYETFRGTVVSLVEADNEISLFEFVLQHLILKHLDRNFKKARPPAVRYRSIRMMSEYIQPLLSLIANVGHDDHEQAKAAFTAAIESLDLPPGGIEFISESKSSVSRVEKSLNRLDQSSQTIKKRVLNACMVAIAHDGKVTAAESELFRAIAESIDCPVPPLMAEAVEGP